MITLFFLYYSIILLLGCILIAGWFTVTRGDWYKNPDETPYWSGKLFSPWLRFWNQPRGKQRYYFKGYELERAVSQIEALIGLRNYKIADEKTCLVLNDAARDIIKKKEAYIFNNLEISLVIKDRDQLSDGNTYVFLFKEYQKYRFPDWVRSPLATCIYCHGSVYGSLIWFLSALICKHYLLMPFSWKLILIFWVPYMVSQSFVAPYLNKKIQ